MLSGQKIIVGVTGSIAAYKSAELVRRLKEQGAEVIAIMTRSATKFISPLTLETVSENQVAIELFPKRRRRIEHISLAQWPDLLVVAPATANIIGKVASGIADDLLSTVIMATRAPVVFAPAMNVNMFNNRILAQNIEKLRCYGYKFIEPEIGQLACGEVGKGRLAEAKTIVEGIAQVLGYSSQLSGKRVLVTAGRTEEDLDPVRFLTNRSTGKMGYALARRATQQGAEVTLISGPSPLPVPHGLRFEPVRTAQQMEDRVKVTFGWCHILIMAAAVSDFRPREKTNSKLKKEAGPITLELERTADILAEIAPHKGDRIVVGFALETENGLTNAQRKLKEKNLDLIVLNDPTGFGGDTNRVTMISRDGKIEQLPELTKDEVAGEILDKVVKLINC